jgi:carbon storage regulator
MLVLSRKLGEEIVIDGCIRVKVVGIQGNRVKLGIVAPESVAVHRQEIHATRMEFAETVATAADRAQIVSSN